MFGRGGIPRTKNLAIDTTGRYVQFDALSAWIVLRSATAPCRIFHSEADFLADMDFYEQGVADAPLSLPLEDRGVWLKGQGGTAAVTLTVLHRKG